MEDEIVKNIAFLSRLKIEDDKLAETKEEFEKIVSFISELNELDTEGVEPLIAVNEEDLLLRDDVVTDENQSQDILKNAPCHEYGYFVVPKVVE